MTLPTDSLTPFDAQQLMAFKGLGLALDIERFRSKRLEIQKAVLVDLVSLQELAKAAATEFPADADFFESVVSKLEAGLGRTRALIERLEISAYPESTN